MSSPEEKGPLELIARALVAVVAVGAIVAAAVCVGTLNDSFGTGGSDVFPVLDTLLPDVPGDNLLTQTRGVSGWIISVGGTAIIIMLLFAILRIVGRGNIVAGIISSVMLGLGFLASGIAAAIFAKDWDDVITFFESFSSTGSVPSEVDRIFASLAAASGLCFLSVVLLVGLVIVSALKK